MPGKTANVPARCFKRPQQAASDITRGSGKQHERSMVRTQWGTSIGLAMSEPAQA